jgi:hypothetical protein
VEGPGGPTTYLEIQEKPSKTLPAEVSKVKLFDLLWPATPPVPFLPRCTQPPDGECHIVSSTVSHPPIPICSGEGAGLVHPPKDYSSRTGCTAPAIASLGRQRPFAVAVRASSVDAFYALSFEP